MPKVQHLFQMKVERAIRDVMAIDPLMTQAALIEYLNKKFEHSFAPRYVVKLQEKLMRRVRMEADHMRVSDRLSKTRETHRIARERLMMILYWSEESKKQGVPRPEARDYVEAAKALVMLDIAVLNAELANGLYAKPIDELAAEMSYKPLPSELRQRVVETWIKWGPLPQSDVDLIVGPEKQHAATVPTSA